MIGYAEAFQLACKEARRRWTRCLALSLVIGLAVAILAAPICLTRRIYEAVLQDTSVREYPRGVIRVSGSSEDGIPEPILERIRSMEGVAHADARIDLPLTLVRLPGGVVAGSVQGWPARWFPELPVEGGEVDPTDEAVPVILGTSLYADAPGEGDRSAWVGEEVEVVVGELLRPYKVTRRSEEEVEVHREKKRSALRVWYDVERLHLPRVVNGRIVGVHEGWRTIVPLEMIEEWRAFLRKEFGEALRPDATHLELSGLGRDIVEPDRVSTLWVETAPGAEIWSVAAGIESLDLKTSFYEKTLQKHREWVHEEFELFHALL